MTTEMLRTKPPSSPHYEAPSVENNDDADAEHAAKARRRRLIMFSAVGAVGVLAAIYAATHIKFGGASAPASVDQTQVVTAIGVSKHAFNPHVALTGEVRPRRDIHVYAPVSGVRVLELLKDEGDVVHAGDPLARLDAAVSAAQISAAEASVAEAESAAVRARGEFERADSIRDSGALSPEQIEQRHAAAVAADARLTAARAQLQEINARLGGGYVRAPASGLVISRTVQLGALVDGQEMFRIAGDNTLEISANVAEQDVLSLRVGQVATFNLPDGGVVEAHLSRPPASIDTRTRTGEALFSLPANTTVRAGMHLSGEIALTEREALAAPQDSIRYQEGRAYVFVVGDDKLAHQTFVELGARDGAMVEILSGLQDGAKVVGAGAAFLRDGDAVRVPEPEAKPAAQQTGDASDTFELRGRTG